MTASQVGEASELLAAGLIVAGVIVVGLQLRSTMTE